MEKNTTEYIITSLAGGKTKEDLYMELLSQGWKVDSIHKLFIAADSNRKKDELQKRAVKVILMIGAVLIGAGILSFIAANWDYIPKPVKVGLILVSMILSYYLGWTIRERKGKPRTGETLYLLGSIIYGAGIFLVGQMFHVRANWPDGFILWSLGTIAIAYVTGASPLHWLAIATGGVAFIGFPFIIFDAIGFDRYLFTSSLLLIAATIATFFAGFNLRREILIDIKSRKTSRDAFSGDAGGIRPNIREFLAGHNLISDLYLTISICIFSVTLFSFNRDIKTGLDLGIILFLTALAAGLVSYHLRTVGTLMVEILCIFAFWCWMCSGLKLQPAMSGAGYIFISLIMYMAGRSHEKSHRFSKFGICYMVAGILFCTGTMYFYSTESGLLFLERVKHTAGIQGVGWTIIVLLSIFCIIGLSAIFFTARSKTISKAESFVIFCIMLLWVLFALLPGLKLFVESENRIYAFQMGTRMTSTGVWLAVIFNAALVLELLGLIIAGYQNRYRWMINLGVLFFFLFITIKYFDWFFTFLNKSIFFVVAGVLVFTVGWAMEKGRRYLLADMTEGKERS